MKKCRLIGGRKRLGHWVRVKGGNPLQVAQIVDERPRIARGAVFVSPALAGLRWWNKAELERVSSPRNLSGGAPYGK